MPSINSPVHIDPTRLQRAVAVAEDAVRNGPYPSAVFAVANAETTILMHGESHPERAPAREDSIFLLASITKPIVATAILRLVEEGRLLLSDPIVKYPSAIYNLQSTICNCKEDLWADFCLASSLAC